MKIERFFKRVLAIICALCMLLSMTSLLATAKRVEGVAGLARQAAGEGVVMLKNDGGFFPVSADETVSLFGRVQVDTFRSGTGSGGQVYTPSLTNILDAFRENPGLHVNEELAAVYEKWSEENPSGITTSAWTVPWSLPEMPLTDEMVANARAKSDKAIVVIGRTAGESKDHSNTAGSFTLTADEKKMLSQVTAQFDQVGVLLNVSNIIDMSWVAEYGIEGVMYVWQAGENGGRPVADVVSGEVPVSGKLTDTIATTYGAYPASKNFGRSDYNNYAEDIYVGYRYFETFAKDDVLYPFGFGLTYTDFAIETSSVKVVDDQLAVTVNVTNTGDYKGKEVVQVYFEAPQGLLGKPSRVLSAFAKTALLAPGASQTITLKFDIADMASYDDAGKTGNKSAYVLEAGDYNIYVGNSARDNEKVYTYTVDELIVTEQLTEALAVEPENAFERMIPKMDENGALTIGYETVPTRTIDYHERIEANLPVTYEYTGDLGYKLKDVYDGTITMEQFVAQISLSDLAYLCRAEGMRSPKVTPGTASAFGGLTASLASYGIPIGCCADGPSGIRMENGEFATHLPIGTMLACTWNTDLIEQLYAKQGEELILNNVESALGPGMNLHRDPLCGRNFEYFSEDPLVTGMMASAITRGVQSTGSTVTLKHFALNNQEHNRNNVDSRVSERAIREIYVKGYEIAVKSSHPASVMTSYNPINGRWAASNYELNTVLLRNEWNYNGMVMTDWWANTDQDSPLMREEATMIEAQNDIAMPVGDNGSIVNAVNGGELTLGEVQRCAINILNMLVNTHAFTRTEGIAFENRLTTGEDWFTVETTKAGDPRITGITVDGRKITTFHPLTLDYEVFRRLNSAEDVPTVAVTAENGVDVEIIQPTFEAPTATIIARVDGAETYYRVRFSNKAGLEPILENAIPAYATNILIDGTPLRGFDPDRISYSVFAAGLSDNPAVDVDVPNGVTYTVEKTSGQILVRCESLDQAKEYSIGLTIPPQSDDFDGDTLSSFWTVMNPSDKYSVADGSFNITTEQGDLYQNNPVLLKNYPLQSAGGDWESVTKVTFDPKPNANYHEIGVLLYQDDNNYLNFRMEYNSSEANGIGVIFSKETNGSFSQGFIDKTFSASITDTAYFKVTKVGNKYTAAFSLNGTNYTTIGSYDDVAYANPKFGFVASNGSTVVNSLNVKYDYVHFTVEEPVEEYIDIHENTILKAAEKQDYATSGIKKATAADFGGGEYISGSAGEFVTYLIDVKEAGTYDLLGRISTNVEDELIQLSLTVQIDGIAVATLGGNGKTDWYNADAATLQLTEGRHTVKVIFRSEGLNLNWLQFVKEGTEIEPIPVNVAYGKPAVASFEENSSYTAAQAVDGDTGTRWAMGTTKDENWIVVDLGAVYDLSHIDILWEGAYASNYDIQVSNDYKAFSTIYTHTASAAGAHSMDVTGSGRYVRINANTLATKYGCSIWELRIYGTETADKGTAIYNVNLAGATMGTASVIGGKWAAAGEEVTIDLAGRSNSYISAVKVNGVDMTDKIVDDQLTLTVTEDLYVEPRYTVTDGIIESEYATMGALTYIDGRTSGWVLEADQYASNGYHTGYGKAAEFLFYGVPRATSVEVAYASNSSGTVDFYLLGKDGNYKLIGSVPFQSTGGWDMSRGKTVVLENVNIPEGATLMILYTNDCNADYLKFNYEPSMEITAPAEVTKNEMFEVTVVSDDYSKLSLQNEAGRAVVAKIIEKTVNEDGTVTTKFETAIGTARDNAEIQVLLDGLEMGSFTLDVKPIADGIYHIEAPESAKVNEAFNVTVVTSKALIKGQFYSETGRGIGRKRVASSVNGDYRTFIYEVSLGTAGENRELTYRADYDKMNDWPFEESFVITIEE